jgi:hypothetical protein
MCGRLKKTGQLAPWSTSTRRAFVGASQVKRSRRDVMNIETLNQQYGPLHATITCAVLKWARMADVNVWPEASAAEVFNSPARVEEFVRIVERAIVMNILYSRREVTDQRIPITYDQARIFTGDPRHGLVVQWLLPRFPWTWRYIIDSQRTVIAMVTSAVYNRYPPHRDEHAWKVLAAWYGAAEF